MNMSDDGLCHFCKLNLETVAHLFFYCQKTNWVLHELEQKMNSALEKESKSAIKITPFHFILGFPHGNNTIRIFVNFIIVLAKQGIWKIRNKIKFDNIQVTDRFILEQTRQNIRNAIKFLESTSIVSKFEKEIKMWKNIF